ncbi:hypothetical protein GCM10009646_15960 [Streptomyces aureus]
MGALQALATLEGTTPGRKGQKWSGSWTFFTDSLGLMGSGEASALSRIPRGDMLHCRLIGGS